MCGRFTLFLDAETLQEFFGVSEIPADYSPRYNIAPSQPVLAITNLYPRRMEWMRWGLIPSWAKDPSIGDRMINARAETLTEKPSFRTAFFRRRCLIPATGFYEWKPVPEGRGRVPYFIGLKEYAPFAFAGLWDVWINEKGEKVSSCAIITCPANSLVAELHDRMPVMLDSQTMGRWLQETAEASLKRLLVPFEPDRMMTYSVSRRVNTPTVDSPDLITPETQKHDG
ncbi:MULTISPECIES: SOS response-associated peptidase [Anaerolinea]|uniref:SOS response-associated peptidase n=1 Tax=Anaerolinea TaxID=233189 RepID=UPI0026204C77|nr:SOS response-associated peptidase [Anaerolinea thermophila]